MTGSVHRYERLIKEGFHYGSHQNSDRAVHETRTAGHARRRHRACHCPRHRGNRERTQAFEGTIIAKKHGGINETITVRRISYGVGCEKVFPVHSPTIVSVETVRRGKVRRAKLYYLRDRVGKRAKVKELI